VPEENKGGVVPMKGEVVTIQEVMILITKQEYEQLVRDRNLLRCLEACGVVNWEGYGEALKLAEEAVQ